MTSNSADVAPDARSDGTAVVGANGRPLWVQRRGTGRPLLMLPGMATSSGAWGEPFLEALGEDLLLLDHRATGRSGRDRAPFCVSDLADDAAHAVASLAVEEFDVLGFSLGGLVAQELALRHADRVRRIVLIGTSAGGAGARGVQEKAIEPLIQAMAEFDGERAVRVSWEASVSPGYAGNPAAFAAWISAATAAPFPLATMRHQRAAALAHDAAERLPTLRAPVLVVHGTLDAIVPCSDGKQLARLIPDAVFEAIEDAGHLAFWEQPEWVARAVKEHLA